MFVALIWVYLNTFISVLKEIYVICAECLLHTGKVWADWN